jgi:diacylglycerol kinase family enzyme
LASERAFTALVNPISGGGRPARRGRPLAAGLSAAGADVRVELSRSRVLGVELAENASRDGRVVVAVGGDGLVRDVAAGVVAGDGTMGIVPAGRGNDLTRALGGFPHDVEGLAGLLLRGTTRRIDVLDAGGAIVPGNVYAGVDGLATEIINANRWIPPLLVYRLAPVRALLRWKPATYTLTLDGDRRTVRAHSVVIGNSGAYGNGMRIVPSAELDDGLIDVLIVGAGPRRQIVGFMRDVMRGRHVDRPEVEVVRAREVTLDTDPPLLACADGDPLARVPVTVRVRPAALCLIAPPPS